MAIDLYLGDKFSIDSFNGFVREFFKHIEKVPYKECVPNDTFLGTIEYYAVHGTYVDPNNNEIIILSVKVKNDSNARQAHRNFISYLLTSKYSQYNAALVAFYDDHRSNWKLSFVTVDMRIGDKGVELIYKPAKRFSFLVGKNEPSKTYKQQLNEIYEADTNPTFERIVDAFSVSRLSNDFYEDYKRKFFELVDHLSNDADFIKESKRIGYDDPVKFAVTFAKKTLGQMVFLHFIQKRGWLGVKERWGDGDKKYILSTAISFNGDNYFNDYLEPFFYNALNKKRKDDVYLGTKIPFLNGGLFYPIEDYDWENTDFHIPNDYWYNDDETGLLNILSQYNFTVDESDPSEQEVAVDPEMLGKIFEKLLDVKDRSSLGAFFTPREIVHFMCEEALASKISMLIGTDFESTLNYIRYGDALKETAFIEEFAEEIDELISQITIVDPAVGSGAFLVGMLNQIVKLRLSLQKFTKKKISKYEMKLQAIQNSLYGVDIEYDAIEIAKLRLWLSLIVDQDASFSAPKPLPNLAFHLRVGNSLSDTYNGIELWNKKWRGTKKPTKEDKQINIFNTDTIANILHRLKDAKNQFFTASDEKTKQDLLKRIEREQIELIRSNLVAKGLFEVFYEVEEMVKKKTKPFFLWELEFDEVFENEGFDIVIMNPPYVDSETMVRDDPEGRKQYAKQYKAAKGNWDLFIIFIELALKISNNSAAVTFICPNRLIGAKYSLAIKKMIAEQNLVSIRDYSNVDVFKDAAVYPVTALVTKKEVKDTTEMLIMDDLESIKSVATVSNDTIKAELKWDKFFYDIDIVNIILKMDSLKRLQNYHLIANDPATVSESYEIKKAIKEVLYDADKHFKFINTGTIDPFVVLWDEKPVAYIKDRYVKPVVEKMWLQSNYKTRYSESISPKIVIGGMTKRLECVFDERAEYLAGKSTIIVHDGNYNLKVLTCILNSRLMNFYYHISYNSTSLDGGFYSVSPSQIEDLPLPEINDAIFVKLENAYDCLNISGGEMSYCDEIDRLVYELYGLSDEEIRIVEKTEK